MFQFSKDYWYHFMWYFWSTKNTLDTACSDYLKIDKNLSNNLGVDFSVQQFAYMQFIVGEMAKILGLTKSDSFGMNKLNIYLEDWQNNIKIKDKDDDYETEQVNNFKESIKILIQEINDILFENKDLIEKIRVNRNKIISHIQITNMKDGITAMDLKLSPKAHRFIYSWKDDENYIDIKKNQSNNITNKLNLQRYHPEDLIDDLLIFKKMTNDFSEIVSKVDILKNKK